MRHCFSLLRFVTAKTQNNAPILVIENLKTATPTHSNAPVSTLCTKIFACLCSVKSSNKIYLKFELGNNNTHYLTLNSTNDSIKRPCILLMNQSPIFSCIVAKLESIPSCKGN